MTNEQIHALACITAAQARIAGMQAANTMRQADGYQLAYDDAAFFAEAQMIEELGIHILNCPQ